MKGAKYAKFFTIGRNFDHKKRLGRQKAHSSKEVTMKATKKNNEKTTQNTNDQLIKLFPDLKDIQDFPDRNRIVPSPCLATLRTGAEAPAVRTLRDADAASRSPTAGRAIQGGVGGQKLQGHARHFLEGSGHSS